MFQVPTLFYNVSLASFPGILDGRHLSVLDRKQMGLVRDFQNNKDFFFNTQNFLFERKYSKMLYYKACSCSSNNCSIARGVAQVRDANGWVSIKNVYFYILSFFSHWVVWGGKQGGFTKCFLILHHFSSMSRLNRSIHGSGLEHMKQMNNLVVGYWNLMQDASKMVTNQTAEYPVFHGTSSVAVWCPSVMFWGIYPGRKYLGAFH